MSNKKSFESEISTTFGKVCEEWELAPLSPITLNFSTCQSSTLLYSTTFYRKIYQIKQS